MKRDLQTNQGEGKTDKSPMALIKFLEAIRKNKSGTEKEHKLPKLQRLALQIMI